MDASLGKVNLVPAEVYGFADAKGAGVDDGDEPLVTKAALRGLSYGFFKHSDFLGSEVFPSANIGVVGFSWREVKNFPRVEKKEREPPATMTLPKTFDLNCLNHHIHRKSCSYFERLLTIRSNL